MTLGRLTQVPDHLRKTSRSGPISVARTIEEERAGAYHNQETRIFMLDLTGLFPWTRPIHVRLNCGVPQKHIARVLSPYCRPLGQ